MRTHIHPHKFQDVFTDGKNIYTMNLVPKESVYGESIVKIRDIEYRRWDPYRSKLSAFIKKGGVTFPFKRKTVTLYLGAASGTTASHISDISSEGINYCIEVSRLPFQKLLFLSRKRRNIIPILNDAVFPDKYKHIVPMVDVIYQDIAQRDQLWIFLKNMHFVKKEGIGIIMVKARSIDVSINPIEIYKQIEEDFIKNGLDVLEKKELFPYAKDHAVIVVRKKI